MGTSNIVMGKKRQPPFSSLPPLHFRGGVKGGKEGKGKGKGREGDKVREGER